jgi:hypothetical protein
LIKATAESVSLIFKAKRVCAVILNWSSCGKYSTLVLKSLLNQVIMSSLYTRTAVHKVLFPAVVLTFQSASVFGTSQFAIISTQSINFKTQFKTVADIPYFSIVSI